VGSATVGSSLPEQFTHLVEFCLIGIAAVNFADESHAKEEDKEEFGKCWSRNSDEQLCHDGLGWPFVFFIILFNS